MGPKPEQTQSSASRKAKQAGCDALEHHAASSWPCAPSPSSTRTICKGIVLLSLVVLVGVLVPSAHSAAAGNHTEWRRPADGGKIQVPEYGGRVPAGYRTAPTVASPKTATGAQAGTRRPGGRPLPTAHPGVLRTAGAVKSAAHAAARRVLQAGAAPKASAAGDSYPAADNTLRADTRMVLPATSSGLDIGATSALPAPRESQEAVNQSHVADTTDIGSTAGPDLATQTTVAVAAEASPAASLAAANAGPAPDAPASAGEGTTLVNTSQTDTAAALGIVTALLPSAVPNSTSVEATTAASEGLPVEVDAASTRTNVDGGEATNATTDVTATVAATSPSIVLSAALGGGPAAAGVVLAANVTDTESVTAPGNVTALLPPSAHNSTSAEAAPGFDGHIAPQPVLEAPLVPAAPHVTSPQVHRSWGSWWKALLQAVRRRMPGGGRGGGRRRLLTTTAPHEGSSTATIGASLDPSNLVEATGVEPAADMPSSAGALPALVNASETASAAALGNLTALLPPAVPNSTSVDTSAASEVTSAAALISAEGDLHPAANSTDAHMMLPDTPTGTPAAAGVVLAANVTGTDSVMAPGNVTALLPPGAPNSSSVEAAPGFQGHIAPQPVLEAPLVPAAPHVTSPKVHRSWGSWWKALLQAVRRRMPGGGRGGGRRRLLTTTAPHEGGSNLAIQLQFKTRVGKVQPHARNPPHGAARRAPPKRTRASHRDQPNRAMDRW